MGTVNDKLLAEIEEAKKGFRVEAPQVDEREDVDISDVNPIQSVLSGVAALATAYVFWLAVGFAAEEHADRPDERGVEAERSSRTAPWHEMLGLGTLLTGITAFAGVGLLALGGKVVLDPQSSSEGE